MQRAMKGMLVGWVVVAMSACSSGPSDSEVENAMKSRIEGMDSGGGSTPRLDYARNVRCKAMQAGSKYTCEVEVAISLPTGGHLQSFAQLQMVKSDGGWTYDKHQVLTMQSGVPQ